jgi:hypothetical protein
LTMRRSKPLALVFGVHHRRIQGVIIQDFGGNQRGNSGFDFDNFFFSDFVQTFGICHQRVL